jgi:hypothetical protein
MSSLGCPIYALWFFLFPNTFDLFDFSFVAMSVPDDEYSRNARYTMVIGIQENVHVI